MAYSEPTASDLKTRYPAFAGVADATVEYWLDDARTIVTESWAEGDRAPAEMALAAHNLAMNGFGTSGGAVGDLAAMGVTSFRSASMSVGFAEATVARRSAGGYGATRYGRQFRVYLKRNRGGARLVGCA